MIAVTEQDNHRVQLFSLHGESLKMFGSQGSDEGKFLYPHHLTFSVKFSCLVSDCVNDRIQVFDKDGEYQFCFGEEGKGYIQRTRGISSGSTQGAAGPRSNISLIFQVLGMVLRRFS